MLYLLLLYGSLADPAFEVRESASERLSHLISLRPEFYGPRLGEWFWACSCPETRSRCGKILVQYSGWRGRAYVSKAPLWPICDAFPVVCPVIPFGLADMRDRGHWSVCGRAGDAPPTWTGYRWTTEQRVREAIRAGMTWDEADALVARMWRLELQDKHDCGAPPGWWKNLKETTDGE